MSTRQKSQRRAPEGPSPASRTKQEKRAQNFPENSCSGQGGQVWGLRRDESRRLDRQIPFWKTLGKDRRKIVAREERGRKGGCFREVMTQEGLSERRESPGGNPHSHPSSPRVTEAETRCTLPTSQSSVHLVRCLETGRLFYRDPQACQDTWLGIRATKCPPCIMQMFVNVCFITANTPTSSNRNLLYH